MACAKPRRPKKPTPEQQAKMQPIIDLCTHRVVRSPDRNNTEDGKRVCVEITWPVVDNRIVTYDSTLPKGLPVGKKTSTSATIRYDCTKLLKWFKDNRYTTYDASDLYKQRMGLLVSLSYFERGLDKLTEINLDLPQD